jgi:preprotein translocase subunit SecG
MQELVFVIHILSILALVGLVLLQHGKGADMGAAFGSSASNTMFGSIGTISFFAKLTGSIAVIFFATSIALGVMMAKQAKHNTDVSLVIPEQVQENAPTPVNEPTQESNQQEHQKK